MATRNLIDYLPPYMQEYEEMQAIMTTEQREFGTAGAALDTVWNNQWLDSSSEEGVQRWERMMNILPGASETLAERKARIYARWNNELPYTYRKLEEYLERVCGHGKYSIDLNAGTYTIDIKIAIESKSVFDAVTEILKKMIPANMNGNVIIKWNTHSILSVYTHSALHSYTHTQLREEVLP